MRFVGLKSKPDKAKEKDKQTKSDKAKDDK